MRDTCRACGPVKASWSACRAELEQARADGRRSREALERIERISGWADHDGELAVQIAREALAPPQRIARDAWAEVARLRAWIDTEGRNCPSNAAVDAALQGKIEDSD